MIDQFLRDKTNHRTDQYGGSIENRSLFLLQVLQAVVEEAGPWRTGIRLSPVTSFGDVADSDPQSLFNHVVKEINRIGPAYIHVIEGETGDRAKSISFDYLELRRRFDGAYIANNEYTFAMAEESLTNDRADLICLVLADDVRNLRGGDFAGF